MQAYPKQERSLDSFFAHMLSVVCSRAQEHSELRLINNQDSVLSLHSDRPPLRSYLFLISVRSCLQ